MTVGQKHDTGKLPYELLPLSGLYEIARVLTYGARDKYAPCNYMYVENGKSRYTAACWRHISKHMQGQILDNETNMPHLAHAGCCMFMIGALNYPVQDCHPTTGENVRMDLVPFAVLDTVVACLPANTERHAEQTLEAWTAFLCGQDTLPLAIAHLLNWIEHIRPQHTGALAARVA